MSLQAAAPDSPGITAPASAKRAGSLRRRTSARRAGLAVLTGLAAFALLQITAAVGSELWAPGMIDPDYGGRLQRLRQGRAADPAHTAVVVALGSSRVQIGLDVLGLEESLSKQRGQPVCVGNFATPGGGPLKELLMWRRLRRDGVRPDLLLVEVMPCFLGDDFSKYELNEELAPASRIRWSDLSAMERYRAGARPNLWSDAMLTEVNALYARRGGIVHTVAPALTPSMDCGLIPFIWNPVRFSSSDPSPEMRQKALERARGGSILSLQNLHFDSSTAKPLRELLRSCRDAKVPVALLVMPEGPVFRSWYPPGTWERLQTWLDQLGREYDAPIINAREWVDEDDFLDSHHLLPQAGVRVTERIGREYVAPRLARAQEPRTK